MSRPRRTVGLVAIGAMLLAGCAPNPTDRAQHAAASATQAVYADRLAELRDALDGPLAQRVTRAQLGLLSDRMHALGAYDGLTYVIADPTTHEYTFRANFARGAMNVVVKLDPSGKLGAYRVFTGS